MINARLPAETSALVLKALEAALHESPVEKAENYVSAETLLPKWSGEKMDLGMAVDGLLRRGKGVRRPLFKCRKFRVDTTNVGDSIECYLLKRKFISTQNLHNHSRLLHRT